MSYILDALKKADAQRERGAVPGLHSQPMAAVTPSAAATQPAPRWAWPALVLLACAALAMGLWLWTGRAVPTSVPVGSGSPTLTPTPISKPNQTLVMTPTLTSAPASITSSDAVPAAAPAVRSEPLPPVAVAATVAKARATPPRAAPAASEPRVYQMQELPDDIRRELPALAVSGSVFSSDAASRVLMVNGQLFHEHDVLAPGVMLEQIKLKSAVLAYKGYRYSIGF